MCESLVYYLEQHTPLIHFQSGEQGAGLRASEVKPRFDRFLHQKYGDKLLPYKKMKDKDALDYKLTIIGENVIYNEIFDGKGTENKIKNGPCMLINMGKEYNSKNLYKAIKFEKIKLIIQSNFIFLREIIDKNIREFFVLNNFGTRKSKGFGCFYIENEDILEDKNKDKNKEILENKYGYKFEIEFNNEGSDCDKDIFKNIEQFWKILKQRGSSKKEPSVINKYSNEKLAINTIKDVIRNKSKKTNITKDSKDILGLSIEENWLNVGMLEKKIEKKIDGKSFKIERFQSPVIFKVFKYNDKITIYFDFFIEDTNKIWDAQCNYKFNWKKNKFENLQRVTNIIDRFSFDEFMKFYMEEICIKNSYMRNIEKTKKGEN